MNGEPRGSGFTGIVAGLTAGTIIGLAVGLLFAPKKGSETREIIRERAEEIRDKATDAVDRTKDRIARMRHKDEDTETEA